MYSCAMICVKMPEILNMDPLANQVAWHVSRDELEEATRLLESLYHHGRVEGLKVAKDILHCVPQLVASGD